MVCDHCGSDTHVTFFQNCPKYCTVCVASGHGRNTNACPNRVCTKCRATGHNARQCTFCDTCQANHAKNKCPRQQCAYCEEYGHEAKQCPEKPTPTCYACGSSTHQTPRSFDCPEHKCATCQGDLEPKGHNHKHCPLAQCESCKLTGHITDVCTFRQCYDVEIDYLNLLLLTKARSTIESYFDATDQASVQSNELRIDGKFSESSDWNHVKQRFVVSVYFAESKIKTLAPSLTRRGSRKLEPTQASSASHSFPLPSPTSSLSLPQLPTATSHSQLPARSPFISRAAPDVYSSGAQSKPRVKGGCETLDARG